MSYRPSDSQRKQAAVNAAAVARLKRAAMAPFDWDRAITGLHRLLDEVYSDERNRR